ncbi:MULTISPECIES: cell division protein FtsA [Hydrocarboniphaga]|uniref:Cell division protein FtsA n=1 Tax=Hydrocarboniphaga effusa AP103 TaxID=1172194 RepID=I7ZBY7_9GAMM|nr:MULTISPECIES: cell division protein FtsA [Hydrocarboniphaga]EIT69177.1 cell division protein FtsA [Hydrocarboniphaga effusa AP103]MDZ4081039.1 cell division protein FtsA [Hydrocarboniphaga sp.]
MAKRESRNLLVGLDIGTSKVTCIVGELMPEGHVEIVGLGSHPSRGLKRGVVVNIEATTQAIRRAVEEAELMAGCRAQSVFVGISGAHIKSHNSVGVVPVRSREVSEKDVESVIEGGRAIAIPADQKVLHVVPQEFVVDGQEGIQEPVGMFGVRLEAKVHIVTGSESAAQNVQKCVESCGLHVDKLCLNHLASAYAVLMPDERELGVCMVDIGGGTSDIAVFKGGAVRHTAVLPVAGDQVTNDISVAFRTPTQAAEDIKLKFGCALPQLLTFDEEIEVPSVGENPPRRLSRITLSEVIRPRYEELFRLIRKELHRSDWYDGIAGGVVLTGGACYLPGVQELAEEVFELPVRLGLPQNVVGVRDVAKSPANATAVGLLLYGRQFQAPKDTRPEVGVGYWVQRVSQWFKGNF